MRKREKKLTLAHKVALFFVVLLAALVLFSNTFRGLVHPRVTVARVKDGTIVQSYTQEEIVLLPEGFVHWSADLSSPGPVAVREVYRSAGSQVARGEKLFALDPDAGEAAYLAARQKRILASIALEDFLEGLENALEAAEKRLQAAEQKAARMQYAPEAQKKEAEKERLAAKKEYERLVSYGVFQGTTREVMENELARAEKNLLAWEEVRKADYCVCAGQGGTLMRLSPGLSYQYTLLPVGQSVKLVLTIPKLEAWFISRNHEARLSTPSGKAQEIAVTEVVPQENDVALVFQFIPQEPQAFCEPASYTLSFESAHQPALVPAAALVNDNTAWVIQPVRNGSETTYAAHAQTFTRAGSNAYFVSAWEGMPGDALVITHWDKPLAEGKKVIIVNQNELQ